MKGYFSTLLPPPNLTGVLHLGHMWNAILQDTLMRYHSSKGLETHWGFGLDHAGISLQVRVESELKKRGLRKDDMDPEEFRRELWAWKDKHAEIIRGQYRSLGYVLPMSEERFTLDEGSVERSLDAFRRLYADGLVYRAEKLVNWDPLLKTAISDIEVIHRRERIELYFLKYRLEDSEDYLEVATTRPETIFGDSALFVNPNDPRYTRHIGRWVSIPLTGRKIRVLADEYVEMDFGTGVMKCTPTHDFQDHQLGLKHNLEFHKVFDSNLEMILGDSYRGLHRDQCRRKLIEDLEKNDLLIKIEPHEANVTYSERSGSKIEPLMSSQWFVRSSVLSKRALEFWRANPDEMAISKPSQSRILETMLENMEDWCISRQLEWGIPIPVWLNEKGEHSPVEREGYEPSRDVFDTWFSSSLWPLVVFEKRGHLLPLSVLISGKDILLFWIARMVFMSVYLENMLPFRNVFLHGLVLDSRRRKMSKSLNNGIDPLVLVEKFGNDVVRLFFLSNTNQDANIAFSEGKLSHFSKFLHKLRNARSLLEGRNIDLSKCEFDRGGLNPIEKWIWGGLEKLEGRVEELFGEYRFSFAARETMDFVWDSFCNRYLELFKLMENGEGMASNTGGFISYLWSRILHLMGPFIPDFAEESLGRIYGGKIPEIVEEFIGGEENIEVDWFFEYINIYESIRKSLNIPRGEAMEVNIVSLREETEKLFPFLELLGHRARRSSKGDRGRTIMFSIPGRNVVVEMEAAEDLLDRYEKFVDEKKAWLAKEIEFLTNRLGDGEFSSRAPRELVEEVEEKIARYRRELEFYP